jgi:hypothetical protein
MTMFPATAVEWALFFGVVTLMCWMSAGLAAVLGTSEEIRHGGQSKASDYVATGLTVVGLISATAIMIAALIVT